MQFGFHIVFGLLQQTESKDGQTGPYPSGRRVFGEHPTQKNKPLGRLMPASAQSEAVAALGTNGGVDGLSWIDSNVCPVPRTRYMFGRRIGQSFWLSLSAYTRQCAVALARVPPLVIVKPSIVFDRLNPLSAIVRQHSIQMLELERSVVVVFSPNALRKILSWPYMDQQLGFVHEVSKPSRLHRRPIIRHQMTCAIS